jgi:Fic family protein
MDTLPHNVAVKKAELDRLRQAMPRGLDNYEQVQTLELTYTSNAIEGNTLTRPETMLVIEQGITIGGKPLKDHLEAIDHHDAVLYIRSAARQDARLTEMDVRTLHSLVVRRSSPDSAGRYADQGRFVVTGAGTKTFPSPAEIPALMGDFAAWLTSVPDTPDTAFTAHRRLLTIHPFNDGNGRTARLLMNLVLIRGGYPPLPIRPEDRPAYIQALERQDEDAGKSFRDLLYRRLDIVLDDYARTILHAMPY